jgi:hypothetical protein
MGFFSLVDSVEGGVSGVELDGGQDGLTAGGSKGRSSIGGHSGGGNSGGSGVGGGHGGGGDGGGSSIGGNSGSSDGRGSGIGGNSGGSSIASGIGVSSIGVGSGGSNDLGISGPLGNSSLSSLISLEESSLSLNNLGGVNNGGGLVNRGNRGNSHMDRGNGEVITLDTEAKSVSNVVDGVDSSLISISVRSSHATEGIARLLLGRVDVLVSIGNIAKLILGLELGAGDSRSSSNRSSSVGNWGSNSGSSNSRGSSIGSNSGGSHSRGSSIGSNSGGRHSRGSSIGSGEGIKGSDSGGTSGIGGCHSWGSSVASSHGGSISSGIGEASIVEAIVGQGEGGLSRGGGEQSRGDSKELHYDFVAACC